MTKKERRIINFKYAMTNMDVEIARTGRLIRRYNRFLADVSLPGGKTQTVHCPNSGSMRSLLRDGARVWLSYHPSEKRRLHYTLEAIELEGGGLACVNTQLPNRIVHEAIQEGRIAGLRRFTDVKREASHGDSRFDLRLDGSKERFVEVKNVTLMEPGHQRIAQFPDSPTTRGQKHLRGLMELGREGYMFFCVNRTDCDRFMIARHIDPAYYEAFCQAKKKGVRMLAYRSDISIHKNTLHIRVSHKIPLIWQC